MGSKKFVNLILFLCFVLILLSVLFNYKIDSFGLYGNGQLSNAAKDIAQGKIIAGLHNFDERIFRKRTIQNIKYKVNWVAIGSSRTMQLRHRFFLDSNDTFQNYSVSSASLEDYIALVSIHVKNQKQFPSSIILGVDPWIFNKNNGQTRFKTIAEDYKELLSDFYDGNRHAYEEKTDFSKLLSLTYLYQNIKHIPSFINGGYYVVSNINVDDYLREPDGSIQYPYKERFPDAKKTEQAAKDYTKGEVYSLPRFERIDNVELFEKFVFFLKSKDVNVYLYLPPYHPLTYDALIGNPKYKIIQNVEEYLINFSKKNDIVVLGSYNPHMFNFKNSDFFDGMHSTDAVYVKIFGNLKRKNGEPHTPPMSPR